MPFIVEAYIDDCKLTATAKTARKAFAEAIDWHIVKQLSGVSINDGVKSYSIAEFSEAMALQEIANTGSARAIANPRRSVARQRKSRPKGGSQFQS